MRFIAYTYKVPGQQVIESGAHDTREAAARELFAKLPKGHKLIETARAVEQNGKWRTYGMDARGCRRDQV